MSARVEWLPVGHIAHGYRRVFSIFEDDQLRHVVAFVPMPYEAVYNVQQSAKPEQVDDPSLWWGLSIIANLVADGTLLGAKNPDTADDGFLQIRPQHMTKEQLLPLHIYHEAVAHKTFTFAFSYAQ